MKLIWFGEIRNQFQPPVSYEIETRTWTDLQIAMFFSLSRFANFVSRSLGGNTDGEFTSWHTHTHVDFFVIYSWKQAGDCVAIVGNVENTADTEAETSSVYLTLGTMRLISPFWVAHWHVRNVGNEHSSNRVNYTDEKLHSLAIRSENQLTLNLNFEKSKFHSF